jgi:hypothetical protein
MLHEDIFTQSESQGAEESDIGGAKDQVPGANTT